MPARKTTFVAFLDLRKAFDTVWRDGLWKKLWDCQIRGKMWRLLRSMYRCTSFRVRVGSSLSKEVPSNQGVFQGAVESPTLFDIYVNDLLRELRASKIGLRFGKAWLGALAYAYDIVLLAESMEDLQKLLELSRTYMSKWRLRPNVGKCAWMKVQRTHGGRKGR